MNSIEISLTFALVATFFATLALMIEKLTNKNVGVFCTIFWLVSVAFIAMYDCHETNSVDLPEETPRVGDVLKVESNKDGVLSLGYYRAAKELKNKELNLDPEYYLEILNQNTLKIQPIGENKTYTCKPNQIDSVLTVDNL